MAAVKRWIFRDIVTGELWTVPINPVEMNSPFAEKNVSIRTTTAKSGQTLLFEGQAAPATWELRGSILDADHHAQLLYWRNKTNRVEIEDHFGRKIEGYIVNFNPTPQRSPRLYFKHEYSMTILVTKTPTAPTKVEY